MCVGVILVWAVASVEGVSCPDSLLAGFLQVIVVKEASVLDYSQESGASSMTVPLICQNPGHILFPFWEAFHLLGI